MPGAAPGASPAADGGPGDAAAFFRQLGEQTSKGLTAAEEAAQGIREQARRGAGRLPAGAPANRDPKEEGRPPERPGEAPGGGYPEPAGRTSRSALLHPPERQAVAGSSQVAVPVARATPAVKVARDGVQEAFAVVQADARQVAVVAPPAGDRGGGGRAAGAPPGGVPDGVGPLVSRQVVAPLRRDLGRMIEPRLVAGDTATTVSERAGDVYRVWKGVRTELLGEGLVYAAFHHGLLDAWREAHGPGKRWLMSPDEADCPRETCRANAAAGVVGVDMSFPSGHLAPPAHGGCTCTVVAAGE